MVVRCESRIVIHHWQRRESDSVTEASQQSRSLVRFRAYYDLNRPGISDDSTMREWCLWEQKSSIQQTYVRAVSEKAGSFRREK